jgi:hypothetical protein
MIGMFGPSMMGGVGYAQITPEEQKIHTSYNDQIQVGGHDFPAGRMTRWDDGTRPSSKKAKTNPNAAFQSGYIHATPFTQETYQADPYMDDRVYTGVYTDPDTGQQYHTFENQMPDREFDQSINPSHETMERLFELRTGGVNAERIGLPDYKPEDNLMEQILSPYDAFAKYNGDPESIREYNERYVKNQLALTQENNYSGIREDMGYKSGYMGLQPLSYADVSTLGLVHRPEDLDHKHRDNNPTSHVQLANPRTDPQLRTTDETRTTWLPHSTYGHRFEGREINQYPGDHEAQAKYGSGQQFPLHPVQPVAVQDTPLPQLPQTFQQYDMQLV